MDFTPAQIAAMDTHGRTLLVSAAAGSGKTFTLTQRIIKSIIEDKKNISEFLIVTFTRAAAGELRAKISKELSKAIEKNPNDEHLQGQLLKLGSASISTIDSFFSEPVRANFEKLGLSASMRLADEAELEPLQLRIMTSVLDTYFKACKGLEGKSISDVAYADNFTNLIGMLSSARNFSTVAPAFLDIYSKLMTSADGIGQLKAHSLAMRRSADIDFFSTPEGQVVRDEMVSYIRYVAAVFGKCCDELKDIDILNEKYLPTFQDNQTLCIALASKINNGNYADAQKAFEDYKPSRIPTLGKNKSEISEYYSKLRGKKLNPAVKDLNSKYLSATAEQIKNIYTRSADICDLVIEILEAFDEEYTKEKKLRAICEFSDMPRFMLKLLRNEDGTPTEYADSLFEKYKEVYIDEYQDVNDIQDTIFKLIGRSHRFMVGDIKQSIYGFREAEPKIFSDYRESFPEYKKEGDVIPPPDSGNTIFMSENFRCDENIIKFTNEVCSKIFSAFSKSIGGYTSADDLVFKKEKPFESYESPKVIVNVIQPAEANGDDDDADVENTDSVSSEDTQSSENSEESDEKLYDEAVITANEIARLLREENKADGTPIEPKDIAVLVRSHSAAKPLLAQLDKLRIKYAQSSKNRLLESRDMKLLVDLLSVIDNPRQDIPLCNVITSKSADPAFSLTLEETVDVRRQVTKAKSLFDAMMCYKDTEKMPPGVEGKCRAIVKHLDTLRRESSKISADKLLRILCHSKYFSHICQGDAYNYLFDCACKYVRNSWNGLYSFLSYFKSLMEKGDSGSEPMKAATDAVTIMSIHQSKGLEFPVCFLFKNNGQFNLSDTKSPILFSKKFGLSMKLPPDAEADENILNRIKVRYRDNALHRAACITIKEKQIEEEARIYYVALTRARERLYLSSTINTDFEAYKKNIISCPDKVYELKNGKSYFHQTMIALSSVLDQESSFFDINVFTRGENNLTAPFENGVVTRSKEAAERDAKLAEEAAEKERAEKLKKYSEMSEDERKKAEEEDNKAAEIKEKSIEHKEKTESGLIDLFSLKIGETEDEKYLANIPAKVAASKVSPNMLDNSVFIPTPTGTLFSDSHEDTDAQSSDNISAIKNRINLLRSKQQSFDSLLEINKKPTAAEIGTATHQFLQFCDFKKAEKKGFESELERLRSQKYISERTYDIVSKHSKKQLEGFFGCELFKTILEAKALHREFKFGIFKDAAGFSQNEENRSKLEGKKIFVQGSIDLIIETPSGEILLCDYKTDRVSAEERADTDKLKENMLAKHISQLREYRYAVEQIFERSPSKIFIYSVPLGEVIEMDID